MNIDCHSEAVEGCPPSWGEVIPGSLYRSSFPQPQNVPFLANKGLKTILILVDTELSQRYSDLIKRQGIRLVTIPISANKGSVAINDDLMQLVVSIVSNKSHHPLLLHCNKGKHRTGCLVACYRNMKGSLLSETLNEYHYHAGAKARPWDEVRIRDLLAPSCYSDEQLFALSDSSTDVEEPDGEAPQRSEPKGYDLLWAAFRTIGFDDNHEEHAT